MSLLRPFALWGMLIIPMILALYIFKNKQKRYTVSSTFLWNKAREELAAEKSFGKLRKSLLMLLQILAAAMCVLAVCTPYIVSEKNVNRYCIIIDNSLSMAAEENNTARLQSAKIDATALVKNSAEGSTFSVYTLNKSLTPIVVSSDDKTDVTKLIADINQSYIAVDYSQLPYVDDDESVILFTDGFEGDDDISVYNYGTPFDNCGITLLTADEDGQNTSVMCKVKNYSDASVQRTINIYTDNKLYKTETVTVDANDSKNVTFSGLDADVVEVKAVIEPRDSFSCDDERYAVVSKQENKRVLLYGDTSMFVEHALSVMPGVEIYKAGDDSDTILSGYDLYVITGKLPDKLPEDGQILFINPAENELFSLGDETSVSNITSRSSNDFTLTDNVDFNISKAKKINLPTWANEIVYSDETPLIFEGIYGKQKMVVVGFSLNESDLPLKKDFPVLIYDMLNYFFPENYGSGVNIEVGEKAEFNIAPTDQTVNVVTPEEDIICIAPPFPSAEYDTDTAPGIYYLEQNTDDSSVYQAFSINISDSDSDELDFNKTVQSDIGDVEYFRGVVNYDLSNAVIVIAILLLMAEFAIFLYKRGKRIQLRNIVLRVLTFIMLILSIFDIRISLPSAGVTTVFVLDTSDSMLSNIDTELQYVNDAVKTKSEDDYVALVLVGNKAEILSSVSNDMQTYNINKLPMGYGSNLQNGIETACSLFKNGTGKRIVLLTDGCENIGSVTSALTDKDIELKVKGFKDEEIAEVQLSSLKVPEYITDGNVKAEISITSTVAETAVLELYVNDRQIYNAEVDIGIGDNRFAVNSNIEETGNLNFKAVVQPTADTYHQNNVIYAHSYTNSAPKILLLEYDGSGAQLEALLKSGDMDVTKTDIRNAPKDIDSLNVYDEILLADCSYYDMSEDFIKSLESYVRSSAGGLLVTGGENAFAPGGYNDTELEKILPVNMEMSDTDKKKKTAMLMVVDRSGSMSVGNYGVSKLELVKEAMVRSVESLDTGDSVGILAFDDANEWIVKPTEIKSDTDNIERKIYGINDGGGTSIQPALEEAVNTLSAYEADSKHIILMTDGQGEDSGYEDVINNALKNNITISTIAVGNDADTELLENIASVAQGRYYYTDEFTDLPRIFERETLLSDKKYVNNESFYPIANETDDIMQGIDMIPELDGYIATDKKTASNVVLSHNNNEPILAIWQYGLGHTAVFTSDVQNQCSSWLSSEEGCTIIKNTVSSLLRSRNLGNIETEVKEKDGNKILSVTVKNNNTDEINGTITGNDTEQVLNFTQVKTGTFEADINAQESGNYVVNIESKGTYDSEFFSGIISIAYPDEYKIQNLNSGDTLLAKLSTIGADADAPKDVFTEYTKEVYDKLSVKQSLLWLALALLYVDVLLRRFGRIKKTSVNETKAKGDKNAVPKPDAEVKKPENKPTEVSTSSLLLKNKRNRQK